MRSAFKDTDRSLDKAEEMKTKAQLQITIELKLIVRTGVSMLLVGYFETDLTSPK